VSRARICKACGAFFADEREGFYFSKNRTKPISPRCKSCWNEYQKQRYIPGKVVTEAEQQRRRAYSLARYYRIYATPEGREILKERSKKWQQENPSKVSARKRIEKHKRRARKTGNGGSFTEQEWQALCARFENRCLRCGEHKPLTADHVLPLSRGGDSNITNIQPLCGPCNSSKGTRFIDYRGASPVLQSA